jgi:hypothetical protein
MSSYTFGNDPNDINIPHVPSTPNACPPRDVEIICKYDDRMNQFLYNCLKKLEISVAFYPSMRKSTPPIILSHEMFCYFHPETISEPKFPIIGEPSSSTQ